MKNCWNLGCGLVPIVQFIFRIRVEFMVEDTPDVQHRQILDPINATDTCH